jgi:ribonuclease R
VEDLGPSDAAGVELLSLMRNHGLDSRFEGSVDHEARQRSPLLSASDLHGREDFRTWVTLTIDPEDARDFDDAISLRRLPDGAWEAGVHIADVAHFVPRDSDVDREARRRGNSVYLTGGFVPMLPPYLTSDVCSLRPRVDRLTHSAVLRLDDRGRVLAKRTCRSVIHSAARLDYDQVQRYMDGQTDEALPDEVRRVLDDMIPLARIIRRNRMQAGSIDLTMPEVKCDLDAEGKATGFHRRGAPEAYHLIEEFMLLANVAVAEILSDQRVPSLYRIHEPPTDEQWSRMANDLAQLGMARSPTDPHSINELCREVAGSPLEYPINLAVLRNLKRALYAETRVGHFGLGFTHYTHFTSPIRRYPDLVVHRILCAVEEKRHSPYGHLDLRALAQHCSATERNADEAENESLQEQRITYYAARLARGEVGPHPALITGVVTRGLLVELEDSLQRGLIPLPTLPPDRYVVDMAQGRIKGRDPRHAFRVGTRVDVELLRVDTQRKLVDFRLVNVSPAAMRQPIATKKPSRRKRVQRMR